MCSSSAGDAAGIPAGARLVRPALCTPAVLELDAAEPRPAPMGRTDSPIPPPPEQRVFAAATSLIADQYPKTGECGLGGHWVFSSSID